MKLLGFLSLILSLIQTQVFAQSGIMEGGQSEGDFREFGKLFGLSTFAYLGEYTSNYLWNSDKRPPSLSYSGYYSYKQASFGIKSMFYTYLNW
jgi:hypothetical protein